MSLTATLHRTTLQFTPVQIGNALRALDDLLLRPDLTPRDRISVESLIVRLKRAQDDLRGRG